MDINYFLHREQVELMRAEAAKCENARSVHLELAELYRVRVEDYRRAGSAH